MAARRTEVFVNYRTVDARFGAAACHELLSAWFGAERVFRDCVSMLPGEVYPAAIRDALEQTRVLVVLIGPEWFAERDGVRLVDDDRDWVRREIRRAFERGIPVVPVLLDGTAPPTAALLPADIAALAHCQAAPVGHRTLRPDVSALAERLTDLVPELVLPDLFEPELALPDNPLPSMVLRAEYGVVPFAGRRDELAELSAWLTAAEPAGPRLVTGPGGQGKTRLAGELVARARAAGWAAGFLPERVPADVLARVELVRTPLLLVVDYAEGRTEQLTELAAALTRRPADRGPVRLLLLARAAGLWQSYLRPRDDGAALLLANLTELALGPLRAVPDRRAEFDRAVLEFARGRADADRVSPPPDLDSDRYARVLDLHAVALAACLDLDTAESGDADRDPVARVLDHEERYWLATTGTYQLAEPHLARLRQVVSAATLFGAADTGGARELLAALPTFAGTEADRVERYRVWLTELYPGDAALNPVRPDRLGEDLVALALARDPELALTVAVDDTQLARALTVLGRAVSRHAHLRAVVTGVLSVAPAARVPVGVAVATQLADATLVAVVAELTDRDPDLVDVVVDNLPDQSLTLAVFAAVQTRAALVRERGEPVPNEETLAWLAQRLAARLTALGEHDDALHHAVDAVRRYRVLAETAGFEVALANALNTVTGAYSDVGLFDDALAAADEAVARLGRLATDDAEARHILTSALMNRGNVLSRLGRHDEAIDTLTDSVRRVMLLLDEHEDALPVDLALSAALNLHNLAAALADADRPAESLDAATRAYEITGRLAEHDFDRFGVDLARATVNLSGSHVAAGQWAQAHEVAVEAVRLATDLVARHGAQHRPGLASALTADSVALRNLGRHADAVVRVEEAIAIHRELLATQASTVLAELAQALQNLGLYLTDLGRLGPARDAYAESADLYRKLADPRPDPVEPELADVLRRLADVLHDLGELTEARVAADEAAEILHRHVDRGRTALRTDLAQAQLLRAAIAIDTDEHAVAAAAAGEAVDLYAAMIGEGDADERFPLERAHALHLHAKALDAAERYSAALPHYRAAVAEYRRHDLVAPHTDALAEATHDLAVCLSAAGAHDEAAGHYADAVRLRQDLLDDSAEATLELAVALYNQADNLRDLNRPDDARAPADQALRLAAELHRAGHAEADEVYVACLVARATAASELASAVSDLADALTVASGTDSEPAVHQAIAELGPTRRVRRAWRAATSLPFPLT